MSTFREDIQDVLYKWGVTYLELDAQPSDLQDKGPWTLEGINAEGATLVKIDVTQAGCDSLKELD